MIEIVNLEKFNLIHGALDADKYAVYSDGVLIATTNKPENYANLTDSTAVRLAKKGGEKDV